LNWQQLVIALALKLCLYAGVTACIFARVEQRQSFAEEIPC